MEGYRILTTEGDIKDLREDFINNKIYPDIEITARLGTYDKEAEGNFRKY